MNKKLIASTLILGFILCFLWIELGSPRQPNTTISKQEFDSLKLELENLKLMLSHNEAGKLKQTSFQSQAIQASQQQPANHSDPLSVINKEYNINDNIGNTSKTVEQIALQEKIAMANEAIEIETKLEYLKTELDQEVIDEQWAPEIEQKLSDQFAESAPDDSNLLETDCRSSFCRITIENTANAEFNPREILGDLFTSSEGFYNKTVDNNGKIITELYVSRNGYNLPTIKKTDGFTNN